MRNKVDFEKLVYEKADEIKARDRKIAITRKMIISAAAVFCVITAGGYGILTAVNHGEVGVPVLNNTEQNNIDGVEVFDNSVSSKADFYKNTASQNTGEVSSNNMVSEPMTNNVDGIISNENDEVDGIGEDSVVSENRESNYTEIYSMPSYSSVVSDSKENESTDIDEISQGGSSSEAVWGNDDIGEDGIDITDDYDRAVLVEYYESGELKGEYTDSENLGKLSVALSNLVQTKIPADGYSNPNCSLKIAWQSGAVWVVDVYEDLVIINETESYFLSDEFKNVIAEYSEK